MPARLGGGCAAGPGAPGQAVSTAVISGRGRRTRASQSATAGASPRASLRSTKPLPNDPDTSWHGRARPCQLVSGSFGSGFVLRNDARGDAPAVADCDALVLRPRPDITAVLTA